MKPGRNLLWKFRGYASDPCTQLKFNNGGETKIYSVHYMHVAIVTYQENIATIHK
jgi:hypothetical protein